ncbi:protein of unknown function DUF169 [Desulfarculus baarsii DSM 2075]|uniref:DUF169 domain-containing protein n=1 Tax=Desulfarculus baarsii (strain ATCC 33931 / DSM 2075 / LMG 7858 / VKM B-1802 / 2st14) TaxID=644282 RepID=E1QLX6_DESB2|nr:DUF169 domain-containing protein [Desulfarculus baarsii]ADK86561.1 protein of unknown function DUF169 [Desulfarculus baarsii DSM 2075]
MNISDQRLDDFLQTIGLDEPPMVALFCDDEPTDGFSPKPQLLPSREMEAQGQADLGQVFANFSCAMGHIWRARKKRLPAWFSAERFGCLGAAFWLGFQKPQLESIIHYVSTGAQGMESEHYCASPDELRRIFNYVDPRPVPSKYLVFKPFELLSEADKPVLVCFFARPEAMAGLHQLATFVSNDPEVVASPWSAGCGSLVAWPLHYLAKGQERAVLGGWDPSARKFYKTDELSFTVSPAMFEGMVELYEQSFLKKHAWRGSLQKIARSKKAWNEA